MEPYSFQSEPCQQCAQSCDEKVVANVQHMLELGRETQNLLSQARKSDGLKCFTYALDIFNVSVKQFRRQSYVIFLL